MAASVWLRLLAAIFLSIPCLASAQNVEEQNPPAWTPKAANETDTGMMQHASDLDSACRGGPNTADGVVCAARNRAFDDLEKQGWCWAYSDLNVYPPDYRWHHCYETRPSDISPLADNSQMDHAQPANGVPADAAPAVAQAENAQAANTQLADAPSADEPAAAPASGNRSAIVVSLVLLFLYMLPAVIAWRRGHQNAAAITILNLLLGWTLLGWIIALVWSFTN